MRHHPVTPSPGDEDLLVLYYPQQAAWEAQCAAMDAAGFLRVTAFNPYWEVNGVTFVDRDGYRTVLQNRAWAWCVIRRVWRRADAERGGR